MSKLRELQLFRHAKSEAPSVEKTDKERAITDKGKKAVGKIRNWLTESALMPDYVLVSSAHRTRQTFKRLCPDGQIPHQFLDELYLASPQQILTCLKEVPSHYNRVMVIGHNPGIHELTNHLANIQPAETLLFPTATMAHLVMPNDWSQLAQGDGKLVHFIKHKELNLKQQETKLAE